jgi:hypothetical protein
MDNDKSEPQTVGPRDSPFETKDGQIAFALYLAGVEFWDDSCWCRNVYTMDQLGRYGFRGLDGREASKLAVAQSKRGNVTYYFRNGPQLQALLKEFHQQESELVQKEGTARDEYKLVLNDHRDGHLSDEQAAIRIACVILKMRMKFMNGWKEMLPFIHIDAGGQPIRERFPFTDAEGRHGVGTRVEFKGYKEFRADASDEALKKIGVL